MKSSELKGKMINATKWSSITEIVARIITPITNMVLARLLAPQAFGVVATVTMIISFADMFTDAGFQKYLVQHEFKDKEEKYINATVAFWTNLGISVILWGIITLFCEPIAALVGNPGLGSVIVVACMQLPLTSFSSIQMALYKRDFDFKTLFTVRIISKCIPFVVTIPLAILGFSYWALVIGTICGQLFNAVILTVKSKWKPEWFYSVQILKEMLSFSIWSLIEAISIWLTLWVDAFVIGNALNVYYLGLYKASIATVSGLMTLITTTTTPILFSALSRMQNDSGQFNHTFFKMQRFVSMLIFPMGVGLYLYSDLATQIFLGKQWSEASRVIGVWALTNAIMIVMASYCSEVYRAKGRPKLSFLAQVLYLVVLVPVCIISVKYGFWTLVYARSWIRLEIILVHFFIMKFVVRFPIMRMLRNVSSTAISAVAMGVAGHFLQQLYKGMVWSFISIVICAGLYFGVLYLFPNMRKEVFGMIRKFS